MKAESLLSRTRVIWPFVHVRLAFVNADKRHSVFCPLSHAFPETFPQDNTERGRGWISPQPNLCKRFGFVRG